jgi:septal ring factor EnvC (AmiA/AmiB activator)
MPWRRRMTTAISTVLVTALSLTMAPRFARADDEPKPEELKQMYQKALDQLKSAQERKTQLAAENEQLKARVAELEKQLAATQARTAELQKQADASAEKTFFLRSHYAAWQEFLRRYPRLQIRWKIFLEDEALFPRHDATPFLEPEWPWQG